MLAVRLSRYILLVLSVAIALSIYSFSDSLKRHVVQSVKERVDRLGRPTSSACQQVPQSQLDRLRQVTTFSVHAFTQGAPIATNQKLRSGTSICLLVAVPQQPIDTYADVPVPGKGPDNLHLFMNSSNMDFSFPPPRPLPNQPGLDQQSASAVALLYHVETTLYQAGSYAIHVENEWANWRWALQWWDDWDRMVTRYPTGLVVPFRDTEDRLSQHHTTTLYEWPSVTDDEKYPPFLIVDPPAAEWERERLHKICPRNHSTAQGTWYAATAFPHLSQLVDEWGYAWDGNDCHYEFFDERDMLSCFADKTIHAYGDSQLRRMFKVLMSGGRFCQDTNHRCQHNDGGMLKHVLLPDQDEKLVDYFIPDDPPELAVMRRNEFGYNTTLHLSFIRSLALGWLDWTSHFYDEDDRSKEDPAADHSSIPTNSNVRPFIPGYDVLLGAKPRMPKDLPSPDVVVLGFGTWDAAFDASYADFENGLIGIRAAVMGAYAEDIPILLRLNNGYCQHHGSEDFRRLSGVRIQHMNDLIKRVFRVQGAFGMDGRVSVFDPEVLTGRPQVVRDYEEVQTNHPRFSHVRVETQMMLHAACERDEISGKVQLRKTLRDF